MTVCYVEVYSVLTPGLVIFGARTRSASELEQFLHLWSSDEVLIIIERPEVGE